MIREATHTTLTHGETQDMFAGRQSEAELPRVVTHNLDQIEDKSGRRTLGDLFKKYHHVSCVQWRAPANPLQKSIHQVRLKNIQCHLTTSHDKNVLNSVLSVTHY